VGEYDPFTKAYLPADGIGIVWPGGSLSVPLDSGATTMTATYTSHAGRHAPFNWQRDMLQTTCNAAVTGALIAAIMRRHPWRIALQCGAHRKHGRQPFDSTATARRPRRLYVRPVADVVASPKAGCPGTPTADGSRCWAWYRGTLGVLQGYSRGTAGVL
jgi:hypothetical protein